MGIQCDSKTLFIEESRKLYKFTFEKFKNENIELVDYVLECVNFVNRYKDQLKLLVREQYITVGFLDRDSLYKYAISEIEYYYKNPYRMIIQYLN